MHPPGVALAQMMLKQLDTLIEQIDGIDRDITQLAREHDSSKRVMTIPRIGPICATAVGAFA